MILRRFQILTVLLVVAVGLLVVQSAPTARAEQAVPGRIAFVRSGNVWVWSNGDTRRLFGDGDAADPRWSVDGQSMLFVRMGDTYSDLEIHYLRSDEDVPLTQNEPQSTPGTEEYANQSVWALDPSWSPSGVIAFVSDNYTPGQTMSLWVMDDLNASPVLASSAGDEDNLESVSLSRDGSVAVYTERMLDQDGMYYTQVMIRDLQTGESSVLVDAGTGAFDAAFAPNDEEIAVTIHGGKDSSDIWLVDRETRSRRQLTHDGRAEAPTWSPDGRWLAYLHATDSGFEIWAMPMNGTQPGLPQKLGEYDDLDATSGLSWTLTGS